MNTAVDPEAIRAFIQTRLLDGYEVAMDEDLVLTGLIDSLGVMALVAHLEKLRAAAIPAQDVTLENFRTINDMVAYLNGT